MDTKGVKEIKLIQTDEVPAELTQYVVANKLVDDFEGKDSGYLYIDPDEGGRYLIIHKSSRAALCKLVSDIRSGIVKTTNIKFVRTVNGRPMSTIYTCAFDKEFRDSLEIFENRTWFGKWLDYIANRSVDFTKNWYQSKVLTMYRLSSPITEKGKTYSIVIRCHS